MTIPFQSIRAATAYCICLLLLVVLGSGCFSYQDVQLVGVKDVQVGQLDAKGVTARVLVEVRNPNNYRIQVKDPDVDLFANGLLLGKATLDSTVTLSPNSTGVYSVPLRATFDEQEVNLLPVLMGAALTKQVTLGAKGTVVGKAGFFLRKRFPFEVERVLDLSDYY
ncbi:MAG TPA: LEA type 2 family protein [Flavobacteriales bacterium]|jgi:LEA14-like dessication related protein|nr:LEA type 2 family protein [Flavobacteriales bacterium]